MDTSQRHYQQFETVFADLYPPLCHYALTFVKDPELCEDIVQEVFARVWEQRKDLFLTDGIRYYLFTAVRNNCISHLRREKSSGTVAFTEEEAESGDYPVVPAKVGQDKLDDQQLLAEAINELPDRCREVFILSRLGNLKYKEIADALGISIKTVENQLSKALRSMREFLKKKGIESKLLRP